MVRSASLCCKFIYHGNISLVFITPYTNVVDLSNVSQYTRCLLILRAVVMKAKNLVQAWLNVELEENEKTLVEALTDLNAALDTVYTHSRIREWEENRNGRGERLPREVRVYMAKLAARSILTSMGLNAKALTSKKIAALAEQFC